MTDCLRFVTEGRLRDNGVYISVRSEHVLQFNRSQSTMAFYIWITVLVCGLAAVTASTSDENGNAIANANNAFGFQWFQLRAKTPGNVLISPFSAEIILSLLTYGAGGTTFSQLTHGLHLPEDKSVIANGSQVLIDGILKAGKGNITLSTANRIYLAINYEIKEDYKNDAVEYFRANIVSTDFMGHPEQSRASINNWVEKETHDKIKDLLPPDSVTSDTRTVLVNVIYFKGNWSKQFVKKNTRSEPFYKSCNDVTNLQMMHMTDRFNIVERPNYKAIQLEYQGKDLHMLIILPTDRCNGMKVEQIAKNINVTELQQSLRTMKVDLTLPKFKIEQTIPMNDDLQALGMTDMFTNSANFSDISEEPIKVSKVIQKTFIEVSEEGTEAAAATAVVGVRATAVGFEQPTLEFRADHPFLFLIVEKLHGAVLFLGTFRG